MPKHYRAPQSYALHAFSRLTPRNGAASDGDDSGDWLCKLEYPDVGREDPCPRCKQPTRWVNSVTVSPLGSAVRYFTMCSPLCRCPDDAIRKEIARLLADMLIADFRKGLDNGQT